MLHVNLLEQIVVVTLRVKSVMFLEGPFETVEELSTKLKVLQRTIPCKILVLFKLSRSTLRWFVHRF